MIFDGRQHRVEAAGKATFHFWRSHEILIGLVTAFGGVSLSLVGHGHPHTGHENRGCLVPTQRSAHNLGSRWPSFAQLRVLADATDIDFYFCNYESVMDSAVLG